MCPQIAQIGRNISGLHHRLREYVEAFVGDGILTNPPATNDAVDASGKTYTRSVEAMPPDEVVREIDQRVDMTTLERVLMEEGIRKFADPQRALIALVAQKREWS